MINNTKYEILTPNGFVDFDGIKKLQKDKYFEIELSNGKIIKSSINHRFMLDGIEIYAYELYSGCKIDSTSDDGVYVKNIQLINGNIKLYDIINVGDDNIFNVDNIISHNCDADFLTSGESVVDPQILQWYKENQIKEPVEKTGFDRNLWIWEYPNYSKEYIVVADVARGDGSDFSACQVFEIETMTQSAEYKGRLGTTDYGNFLIELATKYNDALLVVENNNIGWATIQTIIDRKYPNLFYMSKDLKVVDTENQLTNKYRSQDKNMVPGFSTTIKTRPLIIAKMEEYTREKMVNIHSERLIEELFVFIYHNAKAEAMLGYNDDIVMAYAIALWVRDTALRITTEKNNQQWAMMDSILNMNGNVEQSTGFQMGKTGHPRKNPYEMQVGNEREDLTWLIK
jgi:hypothetical protein